MTAHTHTHIKKPTDTKHYCVFENITSQKANTNVRPHSLSQLYLVQSFYIGEVIKGKKQPTSIFVFLLISTNPKHKLLKYSFVQCITKLYCCSASSPSLSLPPLWTPKDNKLFELVLVRFPYSMPNRWLVIVSLLPKKTP